MKWVPRAFPDGEGKKNIYYKKFRLCGFHSFKNKALQIYLVQKKGGGGESEYLSKNYL